MFVGTENDLWKYMNKLKKEGEIVTYQKVGNDE